MFLAAQRQRAERKALRVVNSVATKLGALPVAYFDIGERNIAITHRGTTADRAVIRQCFHEGQYDERKITGYPHPEVDAYYQGIVDNNAMPLIVDCGANIGASALWFKGRFPAVQIVCLEPEPGNFALLQRNCSTPAYDLRKCGIGGYDGVAVLIDPGCGEWGYRTSESGDGPKVPLVSIRTIMEHKPADAFVPFILKIDIEGAETTLFDGDTSTIDAFPIIIIEPHDWMFHGQGTALGFFRFHAGAGRDFYFCGENIFSLKHKVLAAGIGRTYGRPLQCKVLRV